MALVYDEFNDAAIGSHWTDSDYGGAVTSESEGKLKMTQQVGQQSKLQQASLSLQDYDVWCRIEMPPASFGDGAASQQMWFEDTDAYDGMAGIALYGTTTKNVFNVYWWIDTNSFGENYAETLEITQNYIYARLKLSWSSPDMTVRFFYSLTEPVLETDWIELGAFTITTDWKPTVEMALLLSGNPDNTAIDRTYFFTYFRPWWVRGADAAEPPSIDQYQRLQGYPKVTHPLVFNRNIGAFEVMEQPTPSSPLPSLDSSFVLGYTGNNLTTVTRTIGGITYVKTLTYTGNNLTGVSLWVEQ